MLRTCENPDHRDIYTDVGAEALEFTCLRDNRELIIAPVAVPRPCRCVNLGCATETSASSDNVPCPVCGGQMPPVS